MKSKHGGHRRNIKYICTNCHRLTKGRDDLTAKRITFSTVSNGQKLLRSRTIAWLCHECREADPDWNRPALSSSPGYSDTKFYTGEVIG